MNISTIVDLIKADPTIPNDIPEFLQKMNEQNLTQTRVVRTDVTEIVDIISFAEQHGGKATQKDVQDAMALIKAEPLLKEVDIRQEQSKAAIYSGDAIDSAGLINAFSAPPK